MRVPRSRIGLVVLGVCLAVAPTAAQDGYPLPADLPLITVQNAEHLTELASIGGALPAGLAWSPDGTMLAAGTSEGVYLYTTANLEEPPRFITGDGNVGFNQDGELVLSGQRWSPATGQLLGLVNSSPPRIFSPSGEIEVIPVQQENGTTIQLQRTAGETTLLHIESGYEFDRVVFSPDERYAVLVLTQYHFNEPVSFTQLWDIETGSVVADLPQMLEILDTVAFHADGRLLVTGTGTNNIYGGPFEDVKIWDGRTGERIGPRGLGGLPIRFSPDGTLFGFMTSEGISLWSDRELGLLSVNRGYSEYGSAFVFSPDSRSLAATSGDSVLVWDVDSETVIEEPRFVLPTEADAHTLLYTPDGTRLISVEGEGIVEIWDARTGRRHTRFQAPGSFSLYLSPNGRMLRTDIFGGDIRVWDIETGNLVVTLPSRAVFNTDWSWAAYWTEGSVQVVTIPSGERSELSIIEPYLGGIAAFSPTAEAAIFLDRDIQGYNLRTGSRLFGNPITQRFSSIQFSGDGSRYLTWVAAATNGSRTPGQLTVWDTATGEELLSSREISGARVLYSPDGQFLSSLNGACGDGGGGRYQLWNVGTTISLVGHAYPRGICGPYSHEFNADGKWLIVGWQSEVSITDVALTVEQSTLSDAPFVVQTMVTSYHQFETVLDVEISPNSEILAVTIQGYDPDTTTQSVTRRIDLFRFADILDPDRESLLDATLSIPDAQTILFSPDSRWALTDNGFWNAVSGEFAAAVSGSRAAFHPEGTLLAVSSATRVELWEVAALAAGSAVPLTSLNVSDAHQVAFNADGTILYLLRGGQIQAWGVR